MFLGVKNEENILTKRRPVMDTRKTVHVSMCLHQGEKENQLHIYVTCNCVYKILYIFIKVFLFNEENILAKRRPVMNPRKTVHVSISVFIRGRKKIIYIYI